MENKTLAYLKKRKNVLIKRLTLLGSSVIRGSLIEKYKRCGKSSCKCVHGRGHGPKYYLSRSIPGSHPKIKYIPQGSQEVIQAGIQNFVDARKLLVEISEINIELYRRQKL